MNKKLLAVAVGAVLSAGPAIASAGPTLYGRINIGIASVDNGNTADSSTLGVSEQVSRIGVKGDEDLGGGLKVIYQYETLIDADAGAAPGGNRDVFAGLSGSWGTARLGFFNSSYKNLSTGLELFGDTIGDLTSYSTAGGAALTNEARLANAISYTSPSFAGLSFGVESSRGEGGLATESNPMALAVSYKAGPLVVGAGMFDADNQGTTGLDDATKFVASYAFGPLTVTGILEQQSAKGTLSATNAEVDTTHLGVAYKFGNNTLAATWTDYDSTTVNADSQQIALGLFHALSKSTVLKFVWTDIDNDPASTNGGRLATTANSGVTIGAPAAGSDPSGFELQLSVAF